MAVWPGLVVTALLSPVTTEMSKRFWQARVKCHVFVPLAHAAVNTIILYQHTSTWCKYHKTVTCNPRDMGGVGSRQPVGWDTVVQAEGVETDLEGTEVQSSVSLSVVGCRWLVYEQRRRAIAASFHEHSLRQLKHEVCRRLTRLVGQTRHDAILARLVPIHVSSHQT